MARQVYLLLIFVLGLFIHIPVSGYGKDAVIKGLTGAPAREVKVFNVFQVVLGASDPGVNPYTGGPEVIATFTGPGGATFKVKGFWDGENLYSIRFSPQLPGQWSYVTHSEDSGLNGIQGTFEAISPTPKDLKSNPLYHGFLKSRGYGWQLSDGTPFLPVGETQWSFTEEFHTHEWEDWIRALKDRGYNTFLGCIWLTLYNRAGILPFEGNPGDENLNVAFFQRLDQWVEYANRHGINMGLTIGGFPDNSKWFTIFRTKEMNDRWFSYCVRRYAAYNVRWVLYGEVDEVNPPWATWEENAEAMARLVREEDPYDHPVGSHHRYIDRATARSPYVDFLCIQSNRNSFGRMNAEYQYLTTQDYRQFGKPLMFEEYWYENAEGLYPGLHNTYRNFIAGLAFPTMGTLMRGHEKERGFVPAMAENKNQTVYDYLMQSDSGMLGMQHFARFFEETGTLPFSPALHRVSEPGLHRICGRFGNSYVVFSQGGEPFQLDLTDAGGRFKVEQMDILTGHQRKLKPVTAGKWVTIDPGSSGDVVVSVTGKSLPEYPVINSPLEDALFLPGEKVFLNFEGDVSPVVAEYSDRGSWKSLPVDLQTFIFTVPEDARPDEQVRISLGNANGTTIRTHRIVSMKENKAPVLTRTIASLFSGESAGIQLGFSDPDGPGPYVFTILKEPQHGKLEGGGNDRRYTPDPDFEGTDQFTWTVSDGLIDAERPATVILQVKRKNEDKTGKN